MNTRSMFHETNTTWARRGSGPMYRAVVGTISCAALGLLAAAAPAQAQVSPSDSDSLTFHGITLYGVVDVGLQYDSHGAPISDYFVAGGTGLLQKNSTGSVTGATPNNIQQSRIGVQGKESLTVGDWSGIFKIETYFNPQSGDLTDALKSLTLNNGKPATAQSTGVDSSIAGQVFGVAYVGAASPTYGTVTFGRQLTLLADGVGKYDPIASSYAFSVLGYSGTTAGGGDTEDRRLDQTVKYLYSNNGVHAGGEYKFNRSTGEASSATELQVGGEFSGASVDAYYTKIHDAVSASALSAAQVQGLPALGFSSSNSLAATISDNTAFAVMGSYAFGTATAYAGYEHIRFANPDTPLKAGFATEGGYILAVVNNTAYTHEKNLQVYWAGIKYTTLAKLDLYAAYYGYHQGSYATGDLAGCSTTASAACSGELYAFSLAADYRFTKRFDAYFGAMANGVQDGLANGYLVRNTIDPTLGVRYRF